MFSVHTDQREVRFLANGTQGSTREQFGGLVAIAERCEGDGGPERRVRVLAAIFPNARRIPLDIPRVKWRLIEGRRKEEDNSVIPADEMLRYRCHGNGCSCGIGGAGNHAPG